MPNWVLTKISVEEKYAEKLKKISKIGLGRYFKPIPKELEEVKAPLNLEDKEQKAIASSMTKKYGFPDWYCWAVANWGTKWGCCKNEFEDNSYWYQTAWSPIAFGLIEKLAEEVPDFNYTWEEEQGFGQEWVCKDGAIKLVREWKTEWKIKNED